MKGIITFYLNTHLGEGRSSTEEVELFIKVNQNLFEKNNLDGQYMIAVVPTTKEACRIEKIDFDKPFPRSIPINQKELDKDEDVEDKEIDEVE